MVDDGAVQYNFNLQLSKPTNNPANVRVVLFKNQLSSPRNTKIANTRIPVINLKSWNMKICIFAMPDILVKYVWNSFRETEIFKGGFRVYVCRC